MNIRKFINESSFFCNPFPYIVILAFSGIPFFNFLMKIDKNVFSTIDLSITILLILVGILGAICSLIQEINEFKDKHNYFILKRNKYEF